MAAEADTIEIQEGLAHVQLHARERAERGPGTKDEGVFFNPAMALNRDLSSLLLATQAKPDWKILDGMAATGARGLRYALECPVPVWVQWNDWNPISARAIEANARRNGLELTEEGHQVTHRSLIPLLHERIWHVVDVDPYGSPSPFIDGATHATRDGGLLSLTATDTTALAGVFPRVCKRRYDATPLHGELGHEVALRILIGAATRVGAKHDIAFKPVFSHATDHYYRVTLRARRGAQRADEALTHIGSAYLCPHCGARGFADPRTCPACGQRVLSAGPMWTGPIIDSEVTRAMQARAPAHALARREESTRLLDMLAAEADAAPLYYDLHRAGQRQGAGSPPKAAVFDALREQGYHAAPVHFNEQGVRTDAPTKTFMHIVREAYREASGR